MSDRYLICAFHAGKELHYTGDRFSDRGRSKKYATEAKARQALAHIRAQHGKVLARATLYVRPIAGPNLKFLKTNPSGYARARERYLREIDAADERMRTFSGAFETRQFSVPHKPIRVAVAVGECLGVMYAADRGNGKENFIHRFKKTSRPLLIADADGSQLGFLGGEYEFTGEEGIVDK